jgi:signal transduction histidine kinase
MNWPRRWGLPMRVLAVVVAVMLLDFTVNAVIFERASNFALQEEEAEVLAERLAVAERLLNEGPPASRPVLTRQLSSDTLSLSWSPRGNRPLAAINLAGLQGQLTGYQPSLARARLQLHLSPIHLNRGLGGTLVLKDNSVLAFTSQSRETWPLKAGYVIRLLLPTAMLMPLAWLLVFVSLRPLRKLVRASRHVGTAHARAITVDGPGEVQSLIHAFNAMQQRINDLLEANTQTMLAIGHDMRTPLARLQLRLDALNVQDDARQALNDDIAEMRDLFASLQSFIDADTPETPQQRIDLAAMVQTLIDGAQDRGARAQYSGSDRMVVVARAFPLRRALSNLIENALHYGGNAHVLLRAGPDGVEIMIEDDGPGIPPESLAQVLQPFVRLDSARARNTAGMGLGLAIVDRSLRAEGGKLTLENRAEGGLRACVHLPCQPL